MRTMRIVLRSGTASIIHTPDWSGDAVVRWEHDRHGHQEVRIPGEIFLAVIKASMLGTREVLTMLLDSLGGAER